MSNSYYKFYKLKEILHNETDEEHILSMQSLIERLHQQTGEKLDRRTVMEYIKNLKELGFDISDYNDNGKGYFLRERSFEEHEIRIIMDCITACQFITQGKTKELLGKVEKLGNVYMNKRLKNHPYIDNRSKTCNEQIYYNIDKVSRAIAENKKITFNYCHYNIEGELQPTMQGGAEKPYTVSPIFMVLREECYYLICISDKYEEPTHYRIDRMRMVDILENQHRRNPSEIEDFKDGVDAASYTRKSFKMYSGKDCRVVLKVKNYLLDKIIDELGEGAELTNAEEGCFTASFTAKYSQGLRRWILQLGNDAKVLEPVMLVMEIKEEIESLKRSYD